MDKRGFLIRSPNESDRKIYGSDRIFEELCGKNLQNEIARFSKKTRRKSYSIFQEFVSYFRTVVHSQMDVSLKGLTSKPTLYKELPSAGDEDSESSNDYAGPQDFDISKLHEKIQAELSKLGERMDSAFPESVPFDRTSNDRRIPIVTHYNSYSSDAEDEQNPLLDLLKFMNHREPNDLTGSRKIAKNGQFPNRDESDEDEGPIGVLTVITVDDGGFIPRQNNMKNIEINLNNTLKKDETNSILQGFSESLFDSLKTIMNVMKNSTAGLSLGGYDSKKDSPVNIKIEDHGRTYDIPPYAHVERSKPDMVNITWNSNLNYMKNSLCMNVSKDADGAIIFNHIRLRMFNENGLQEYNKEDPIRIGQNRSNNTEINLAEGVELQFPHPSSLDVVVVERRGKFNVHWMAVSIALLGLIVAGLVLLLSYILHAKNKYSTRNDSMYKEPIA